MSNAPFRNLGGVRVLVTGGSGFIGRHLCRRLLGEGAEVHAVSLQGEPRDDDVISSSVTWHRADLTAESMAKSLVRTIEPEAIIHLASLVKGSRDRSLVAKMLHANLATTVYLMDAAVDVECGRFVQLGSLEQPESLDEAPCSPYAAAKVAATVYARMYADLYDLSVVTARVFMVYGPGPQDPGKLVPYVVRELLAGRQPRLSSGQRPVDWIFVDDVVDGLVRMARCERLSELQLDLGSGKLVEVREVVRRLYALTAPHLEPRFGDRPDRLGEAVRSADVAATTKAIGWRCQIDLDQGLAATVESVRQYAAELGIEAE